MSILTRLPDIIASAAGVLFQEYTIRRFAGRTSDGRGGFTATWETYVVKGQVTEYSDEMRYLRSIPEDARKLIIQGKDIPQVPQAEDYVAIEGASWKIISVDTVPSNAVYECEVHPDTSDWGIDLATTTSTTPAILQDLETTVSAVGNLLFEDLQFFYLNRYADDGRGGNVRVLGAIDVRGLVTEYSERMRAIGGFQPTDRQVIIQGKDLAIEPGPGDIVRFGSEYFVLTNVRSVPGKAVYEARGRPTTADAATLPTITADAIQTMDDFTASSFGEIVAIVGDASALLEPFTASGFGQFTIEGDASAQMDHFTGDGFAWVTEVGVSVNQVEDFTCSSDATLPISADAAATLDNFVSPDAQADLDIEGDGGAVMDDFTGSSLALLHIEADASGALEDFTGASSASQQNQGNADVTLDHFTGAGEGDPLITGDQSTQVVDFTSVSVAENPIEANASQTLEAFTSVADAVLAIEASSVAVVADFVGSGSGGQGDLEATAAATLVNFTGSSDATLAIEADASATLDAFVGTAIGEPILEGQHGGVMDDFTGLADATLPVDADASATLDSFTGVSDGTLTEAGPPTLDAAVVMAWDPVGSTASANGIGSHPDIAANYALWPIDGLTDTVDTGWAGAMDGTGANHLVIDNADLVGAGISDGVTEYSVSFWHKRNDTPNDYRIFFGQGANWPSFGGNVGDYGLRAELANLFQGARGTSWGSAGDTGADPFDGTWHHITMTIADQAIRVYVDGVLERSVTGSNFPLSANASAMVWGRNAMNGDVDHTANFSDGQEIDHEVGDIRIYNKELNATEIAALHSAGRKEYAGQAADAPPKAETTALLNAMVNTQTAARQDAIDDLMAVMVDEGIFALLDWFCIVGADDDACLRNWIDPTQTLVQTNNAQLVHDSYFDTKSNPSGNGAFVAEAVNLTGATLGDLTFGNYFVKLDETGSTRASRLRDNKTYYRCDFSAPIQYLTGTNMGNSYASRVVNDPYHMTMVHRGTGAADREGYYQGVSYFTGDGSGGSLTTTTTIDLIGTAAKDSDERVLCGYFGRALSSAQVLSLHNAIEAYKTAIGA